jgi:hypothetical protein
VHGQEQPPLVPVRVRPPLQQPVRQAGGRMDRLLLPLEGLHLPEGVLDPAGELVVCGLDRHASIWPAPSVSLYSTLGFPVVPVCVLRLQMFQ